MNKTIGFVSGIIISVSVGIFFLSLALWLGIRADALSYISYGICIFLAWGYVGYASANTCYVSKERKAAGVLGISFAILYAVFVTLVYYTQITNVRLDNLDPALEATFGFSNAGSWLFNLDLFGYGLMAISTFFVGLSIQAENKKDKWLKKLLMIHGIFSVCMVVPLLPFSANEAIGGTIALMAWCLYFLPIGILTAVHFKGVKE